MTAPADPAQRRGRFGWLAGVLTFTLLAGLGVLLATPSDASLPRTVAAQFLPADATRGKVTLQLDGTQAPAELFDARYPARAVGSAVSPTGYATVGAPTRTDPGLTWFREAIVPAEGGLPARQRWRTVDARGVWLVLQEWDTLGVSFDGLLELPADVAVGRSWTSTGTAHERPADGELRFEHTASASAPTDPARLAEGCLSVQSRTTITGAVHDDWSETSLWCPGKGVVAGTGTLGDHDFAVSSGGAANPVTDDDLAEAGWDPSGAARWRLTTPTVQAGDPTFGLVVAATTPLLEAPRPPVVTADGTVVFPTLAGGDLAGVVDRDGVRTADWWARPGGQVTTLATVGTMVLAPTTAHRLSAYRAGRTLAWNADLDDVAVAPPLATGDLVLAATVSGTLSAFDVASGATVWSSAVGGGVHAPLAAGDGVAVSADTGSAVTAWDLTTGARRWRVDDAANPFATTLLVGSGLVVVAAGASVTAYAVADGHRVWVRDAGLDLGEVTLVGDQLWLGRGDRLEAWSVVDGTTRWTLPGAAPLTTTASRCDPPAGGPVGLARRGDEIALVSGAGVVTGAWPLALTTGDVLTATCRGAGVDLTAYAPGGSHPLRVLRLGSP